MTEDLPRRLYDWPPEKEYEAPQTRSGTHPAILALWSLLAFGIFFYFSYFMR